MLSSRILHRIPSPPGHVHQSYQSLPNRQVDVYDDILNRVHGGQRLYLAANSFKEINTARLISPPAALDYVAKQNPPGLPPHTLTIKFNSVYCLLRNFSKKCTRHHTWTWYPPYYGVPSTQLKWQTLCGRRWGNQCITCIWYENWYVLLVYICFCLLTVI